MATGHILSRNNTSQEYHLIMSELFLKFRMELCMFVSSMLITDVPLFYIKSMSSDIIYNTQTDVCQVTIVVFDQHTIFRSIHHLLVYAMHFKFYSHYIIVKFCFC